MKTSCPVRDLMTVLGRIRSDRIFYCRHEIKKSTGGTRVLNEPPPILKEIQEKIKDCLLSEIFSRQDTFGFSGGGVIDTLKRHLKSKYFFMLDIKDAFNSVNPFAIKTILKIRESFCQKIFGKNQALKQDSSLKE